MKEEMRSSVEDVQRAQVAYLESALNSAEKRRDDLLGQVYELDHKWESVPWKEIEACASIMRTRSYDNGVSHVVFAWLDANAPKEEEV